MTTRSINPGFVWQMARAHDTWLARAFPRLPEHLLQRATAAADVIHLRPGAVLMHEGEAGEHVYVIARGRLDVSRGADHLASVGPGTVIGEAALLGDGVRNATVSAPDAAEVLELDRVTFTDLLDASPETTEHLDALTATRGAGVTEAEPVP